MSLRFFYLIFFAIIAFSSCIDIGERVDGNGNIRSENRKISEARRIKVAGDMNVFIEKGPVSLKVEGDDNLLEYLITEFNNNWLEIRTRDNVNLHSSKPIKVYVTTPEIIELKVSGSGNIKSNPKFSTDRNTSFDISGSGDITAAINAPKVESHISGSGNLHISGETKDVEIHISGSGNYDGPGLKAENASVNIAGSGDANLFADDKLKASIAGSGNIKYKGNATVESHIAGSGSVSREQ
jgi:hypothetical protein